MSFSARRTSIVAAVLLAGVAFFALSVMASGNGSPARADGSTVAPSPSSSTTPAQPDGAIWG